MDLAKRIFEHGVFFSKPFPHWVVKDFFDTEDLEVVCQDFPSAEKICDSLKEDLRFLVNNWDVSEGADAKKVALARLGFRLKDARFNPEIARAQLDRGSAFSYLPGVSYSLQMGENCVPINPNYTGSLKFDNLIRRLELDWWESRSKIVKKVTQTTGYMIPDNMDFISRGDLRAASPSSKSDRTTLGPHVDSEKELFAGLIYLKSPLDTSNGGDLILYELKDDCPKKYMSDKRRIPMRYLNPVKTIEYGLNNAVFFVNSPISIHSVSSRTSSSIDRRNINLSLECPGGGALFNKQKYVSTDLSGDNRYGFYQNAVEKLL